MIFTLLLNGQLQANDIINYWVKVDSNRKLYKRAGCERVGKILIKL